jgi:hypothetical protein
MRGVLVTGLVGVTGLLVGVTSLLVVVNTLVTGLLPLFIDDTHTRDDTHIHAHGTSCSLKGSGSKTTMSYNFSEYARLVIYGDIDAEVTVGNSSSISVTLYENIAEHLDVHVVDLTWHPTLVIRTPSGVCNSGAKVVITVTEPLQSVSSYSSGALSVDFLTERVHVSGSGSATIDAVTGHFVSVSAYGSSRLIVHAVQATYADVCGDGTVVLGSLTASIAYIYAPWLDGSADVNVDSGDAKQVNVSIKSSGTVTLGSLTTISATIISSGSASVSGMASKNLYVQSSGGGSINTSATESFHGSCSGNASVYITGGAQVSGSCQ